LARLAQCALLSTDSQVLLTFDSPESRATPEMPEASILLHSGDYVYEV
jgi:hypothetical protein